MPHKDKLLTLVLDALNRVDHADVLAHLEGCLCNLELHKLQTLLSKGFKEDLGVSQTSLRYLNTGVIPVDCKVLEEESKMSFI